MAMIGLPSLSFQGAQKRIFRIEETFEISAPAIGIS
jgi:hypothetical protein